MTVQIEAASRTRRHSRFRGVYWETERARWAALLYEPGPPKRAVRIAHFEREEDAALAYDRVVLHVHGLAATRNFPERAVEPASVHEVRQERRQERKRRQTSCFEGVYLNSRAGVAGRPWHAEVRLPSSRLVWLGSWATEQEAAVGRDRAALFYGRTDALNFPKEALRLGPANLETLRRERVRARKATTTSRYVGVTWAAVNELWRARITVNYEVLDLGLFDDEVDAGLAYDKAALKFRGAHAKLNFPAAVKRPSSR